MTEPSPAAAWEWIVHVDMDCFFAAVEQRDKPSLKGRPVIVGGTGGRGVVATASYEARRYGVRSAMPVSRARQLCPEGVYLPPRFQAYKEASGLVMGILASYSPRIEPLSMDEAYLDLSAGKDSPKSLALGGDPVKVMASIREEIRDLVGITASAGAGRTKLVAKLASDAAKPDGLLVVLPEREEAFLRPRPVGALQGIGPMTLEKLHRLSIRTVADLAAADVVAVASVVGKNLAQHLVDLANGRDERRVEASREAKSVSQEETLEVDVTDPSVLTNLLRRQAGRVAERLREGRSAGRTVTLKVKFGDFRTVTRSTSLPLPTDDPDLIGETAARLLAHLDVTEGVRLVGVGVSGIGETVQGVLAFERDDEGGETSGAAEEAAGERRWFAGEHVKHALHGRGWVERVEDEWVHVRFETRGSGPGELRTFSKDLVRLEPDEGAPR